jgi:hypothetical protein
MFPQSQFFVLEDCKMHLNNADMSWYLNMIYLVVVRLKNQEHNSLREGLSNGSGVDDYLIDDLMQVGCTLVNRST